MICVLESKNRPAEDRRFRSNAANRGVRLPCSTGELSFSSGYEGSTTLLADAKDSSCRASSDDWNEIDFLWYSPAVLASMNSPSALSPLAFSEYSVLSELLSVLWPPHGSGSFSCKSDAVVSSEGKLTLWVFKKETLFVLPRLLSSCEISKSLTLALFLPAFDAAAFFSLDLSSSFRKSVKDIWSLHQLRKVHL